PQCFPGSAAAVAGAKRRHSAVGSSFHAAVRETDEPTDREHSRGCYGRFGALSLARQRAGDAERDRTGRDSVTEWARAGSLAIVGQPSSFPRTRRATRGA